MKTLKEHQDEKIEENKILRKHKKEGFPAGIHCPECGRELVHKDRSVLMSMPPQKNVECNQCGFKTRIFC